MCEHYDYLLKWLFWPMDASFYFHVQEWKKPGAVVSCKVNFSECCNISDSTTSRTSAAAIEFIIMHLCRLKLILGVRVSERIRAAGDGGGGGGTAVAISNGDSAEIPRLNSRSWLVSQLTFLHAFSAFYSSPTKVSNWSAPLSFLLDRFTFV